MSSFLCDYNKIKNKDEYVKMFLDKNTARKYGSQRQMEECG
jgi:hypothetical protein